MPLCERRSDPQRYLAVVAVPTFNAAATIEATLASIAASIRSYRDTGGRGRVAISVVDDASADPTPAIVSAFATGCGEDFYLTVHPTNTGRARARNDAITAVDAECCLFLDHDDRYEPEHITVCLDALHRHDGADFVKTRAHLSDRVHSDWEPRIASSLTQNLCVRCRVHRLVGGFLEDPDVELYGCDDLLYNRLLRACCRGIDVPQATVTFMRRPGNSFDRQYERKFTRPAAQAEVTLSAAQQRVEKQVFELYDRRLAEVQVRIARLGALARSLRPGTTARAPAPAGVARPAVEPEPFSNEGERVFAVMITGASAARAGLARASLDSFLLQQYPNRALVVVNDGPFEVDVSAMPRDRVVVVRPAGRRSLGALRNLGLNAVPDGALWTYWDDDDWHHPNLIAAQRSVLSRLGAPACFLAYQVKYGVERDVAFVDYHPGGFAGTLMTVKHASLRFPDVAAGEDSVYTAALKQVWPYCAWPNPPHYFLRLYHGSNTWDASHFGIEAMTPGRWDLPTPAAAYLRSVLPLYERR